MDYLTDRGLDTVIACDVLEHVLTVPHGNDLKVKMELSPDISRADRLRLAGQEDHQRIYREDFAGLLEQTGFYVMPVDESNVPASFVRRHCLRPPVALYAPAGQQPPESLFREEDETVKVGLNQTSD
jgi:hypothetical protein